MEAQAKKQKIFVGVSGGVDSSVAAYLLKEQGHDVQGVFVKTWSPEWLPCTWIDEKRDAMRVCAALDIPFHFIDAEEEYKKGVAEYMIAEYKAGRTPNPDVLCNRVIKFGVLWDYAASNGGDVVATGHYAQTNGTQLIKGADPAKDQSYFLWMLTKEELGHVQFPMGHLQKSEVRAIAEKINLFTSSKKDSQGICFVGDVDMREFLSHYIEQKSGEVVNEKGEVVGSHDGVWFYTLGERHGFHISTKDVNSKAQYVIGKDIEKNRLIVSDNPRASLASESGRKVSLQNINWIAVPVPGKTYEAQIRYHGTFIPVVIEGEIAVLTTDDVISPGQSIVFYEKDILIGGAVITAVY